MIVDEIDPRGKVIESKTVQEGDAGQDLVTTVDPALQRSAEALLDSAVARRIDGGNDRAYESGGAVLVMDIHDGAILAAASTPRFDPNAFIQRNNQEIQHWMTDADRPLFDRTVQMALPPGSVFKIISAAALLDSGVNPAGAGRLRGLSAPARCAAVRDLSAFRHRPRTGHAGRCAGPKLQRLFFPLCGASWRRRRWWIGDGDSGWGARRESICRRRFSGDVSDRRREEIDADRQTIRG